MKAFKTEVKVNSKTKSYLDQAFGMHRFAWNWAMNEYFKEHPDNKHPSVFDLSKKFNHEVIGTEGFEWVSEINSMFRDEAFKDFGLAIKQWRDKQKKSHNTTKPIAADKFKPKFKKKGKCNDSARMFKKGGSEFKVQSSHVFTCVRIRGQKRLHIKTFESLSFLKSADIKTVTFSRIANKYYMSITYEKTNHKKVAKNNTLGIDLGIKTSVACYDGVNSFSYSLPSTLKRAQRKTERINRIFSRTQKDSKRHLKLMLRLQKAYQHEANIKKDFREKLTTELADNYNVIKIDDFSFNSALNFNKVSRKLHDVSPYAFKQRLEQKCQERGSVIVYLPKFTPSTKTCSCCGNKQMLKLSDRVYNCPSCGLHMDRDSNSAKFAYNY